MAIDFIRRVRLASVTPLQSSEPILAIANKTYLRNGCRR